MNINVTRAFATVIGPGLKSDQKRKGKNLKQVHLAAPARG